MVEFTAAAVRLYARALEIEQTIERLDGDGNLTARRGHR
jgi:hypothetical protein